jgi:hypothetical protein
MPRSYRQLTLEERRTIYRLLGAKIPWLLMAMAPIALP